MKILNVLQGSTEWHEARAKHFCASEAAAMMGYDKKMSRTELLRLKATGAEREFSDWVQKNLLDRGHEIEAVARPIAETVLGQELYPCTGTLEVDGLPLLASFDGVTMDGSVVWECKMRNADLVTSMAEGDLPNSHWPQIEQQLLISGAGKALFTATDGTEDGTLQLWYESKPARRAQLIASSKQFDADRAAYQHVEVIPAAVAASIEDLPALTVELVGQVKNSNLVSFKAAVMARIQAINTDLQTDEDFATADKMVKFLDDGEARLDLVKSQALAQTSSIDELFRTIDSLKGEMRAKRLTLNNLVEARKKSIRAEILQKGQAAFAAHLLSLNTRLGKPYMSAIPVDFVGAVKNKRTISSLHDAVNTELARAKIEANAVADRIQINLNSLRELANDHAFLFADTAQIVLKENDDLTTLIKLRIAEHKAKEEKRVAEERARLRAEELARIEAERVAAEKKAAAERFAAEMKETERMAAVTKTLQPAPIPAAPVAAKPAVAMVKGIVRPTDDAIIEVLALAYRVHESKVIEWLLDMDLYVAKKRMAKEFT